VKDETMTAPVSPADELRELHEDYVWEINAAVGRGEDHIVDRLARRYTEAALRLICKQRQAG
jgi:hypothetical protein